MNNVSKRVEIYDKENKIWKYPAFIRKFFIEKYYQQGLVQMDSKTNHLVVCGDCIKWLENVCVETTSQKRADKLTFEYFDEKYPQYKKYIQLF